MEKIVPYSYAVLSDFDGTMTDQDSLQFIFNRYASDDWLQMEASWRQGILSTQECLQLQLALVESRDLPTILHDLIQSVRIASGFPEFIRDLKADGVYFGILSDGLDIFIDAILRHHNLVDSGSIFSNQLVIASDKLGIHFPYANAAHRQCANCKGGVIQSLKEKHGFNKIIFVGDGLSDRCAVRYADIIFAKDSLARYCQEENIPFIPFVDYHDVRREIACFI